MSEKPILFSTPMVQAILEGRKTMTRRVIKEEIIQNADLPGRIYIDRRGVAKIGESIDIAPYKIGDLLWVRESFQAFPHMKELSPWSLEKNGFVTIGEFDYCYKADDDNSENKWRPSIFMPREASRILLEVKGVRIEQIQDISNEDAKAEGVGEHTIFNDVDGYENIAVGITTPKQEFRELWDHLNAKRGYSWESNPWVFVYEFMRVK
jgi:hypothetical protein